MANDSGIDKAESLLIRATLICVFFMAAEVLGGYLSGSLAIMTDAAHLLSDVLGFGVSLVCLRLAKRKATAMLSFGFKRAEVLGALLSVSTIWVVTGFLVAEAVQRTSQILDEDPKFQPVNGEIMFAVACLGLCCNLVILRVLGHSHSHGPGGSHGHSHGGDIHGEEEEPLHSHSHDGAHPHSHEPAHGHSHDKDHGHSHDRHGDSSDDDDDHGHSHGKDDLEHGHAHSHDDDDDGHDSDHSTPPRLSEEHEMNGLSIRFSVTDYGAIESPTLDGHSHADHKQNLNVEAAYIHALGDLLQSVGVIIAGGLIWKYPAATHPKMQLADPLATFLFSLLVLYSTWQVIKTAVNVLMEGVPAGLEPKRIKRSIERLPGVAECHDLHVWSLSLGHPSLSVHVVLEDGAQSDVVLRRVHQLLYFKYRISHATVQVEPKSHYSDGTVRKPTDCHEYHGE